ncbi:MAG: hypothetical protein K2F76_08100, partial [Duncaniella dubosii]|nr:hypothetical protein [Duncaniella dubosii]
MKPRMAMITIVSVSALFTIVNFALASYLKVNINIIVIIDVVVWTLGNYWVSRKIKTYQASLGSKNA